MKTIRIIVVFVVMGSTPALADIGSRDLGVQGKADKVSLVVEIRDAAGRAVAATVRVVCVGTTTCLRGESRSETGRCSFEVPSGGSWRIHAEARENGGVRTWRAGKSKKEIVRIVLPSAAHPLSAGQVRGLTSWFAQAFQAIDKGAPPPKEPSTLNALLKNSGTERTVRELAWSVYQSSLLARRNLVNFKRNEVRHEKWRSPYTVKNVGRRPASGWPLVIALHGGGSVPKELNDSQWRHMQIYYKDHPKAGGYRYVALRAPNDTWNGFYDNYVYPLIANLIRQFLVHGDVDPDRVYVIGYSHGGYGTFSIAPKIPHRFAAAHASASAPTDRETSAHSLRNLPFTFMVGGKDTAFGRADRCQKFARLLGTLQAMDSTGWPCRFQWQPRHGHGGLPDRDHLPRLLPHRRGVSPRELDWELTDTQVRTHYWLNTETPAKKQRVRATLRDNRLIVDSAGLSSLGAILDGRRVVIGRPLLVTIGPKSLSIPLKPSLTVLAESLHARGDPHLSGTVRVPLITR